MFLVALKPGNEATVVVLSGATCMALHFFKRKKGPEPVPERDRIRKVPVKHEYSRPVFLELSKKQADSKDA